MRLQGSRATGASAAPAGCGGKGEAGAQGWNTCTSALAPGSTTLRSDWRWGRAACKPSIPRVSLHPPLSVALQCASPGGAMPSHDPQKLPLRPSWPSAPCP